MKKTALNLLIIIFGFSLIFFSSCKDDNDDLIPSDKIYEGNFGPSEYQELLDFYEAGYTIINGDVEIDYFENLKDLKLLTNLKRIHGYFQIIANPELESLEGLNNIDSITSSFNIISCDKLSNFGGLDHLIYIGGDMRIMSNDLLENLDGINHLEYVGAKLKISGNHQMTNLQGLENLKTIDLMLEIGEKDGSGNDKLESLEALTNLEVIRTRLEINNCSSLISLNGLENIHILGSTVIRRNHVLSNYCALQYVMNNGDFPGEFSALYNEYNPSKEDIQAGECSQ